MPARRPDYFGRALNRAEEIRLVADYRGDSVEFDDARGMVEQAEVFVEAMRAEFMPDSRNHDGAGIQP